MTNMLKNKLYLFLSISLVSAAFSVLSSVSCAQDFDYTEYNKIILKYVYLDNNIKGYTLNVVDYENLFQEHKNPSSSYSILLKQLSVFDPDSVAKREDRIAFWINAYNIGAIKMILDHYPVDSIRSTKINWFKNPWNKKIITINGNEYSLGQIEHDILLGQYGELMAHYAIVCASLSCPEITQEVYRGDTLVEQLARQARQFLRDMQKGLKIDRENNVVHVSSIFKFDSKNFKKSKEIIIDFILPYVDDEKDRVYLKNADYELKFLDYNWELNTL